MAIARPRDNISTTSGSATPACSFATLPAAGSLVVVVFASWKASTFTHNSVADNQGNGAYTQVGTTTASNTTNDFIRLSMWYKENIAAPSGTFTVTCTASSTVDARVVIAEYTGIAAASPLDAQAAGTPAATTNATVTLAATTQADELLIGGMAWRSGTDVTLTEDATNLPTLVRENEDNQTNQAVNVAERILSATGTYTANWALSASRNWICQAATFKAAAGGAAARAQRLTLLGVG